MFDPSLRKKKKKKKTYDLDAAIEGSSGGLGGQDDAFEDKGDPSVAPAAPAAEEKDSAPKEDDSAPIKEVEGECQVDCISLTGLYIFHTAWRFVRRFVQRHECHPDIDGCTNPP